MNITTKQCFVGVQCKTIFKGKVACARKTEDDNQQNWQIQKGQYKSEVTIGAKFFEFFVFHSALFTPSSLVVMFVITLQTIINQIIYLHTKIYKIKLKKLMALMEKIILKIWNYFITLRYML